MKAISRAAIALSLCVPPSLVCGQTVSAPILIGTPTDPGRVVFTSSVAANPVAPMAVTAAWEEVDAGRVVGSRVYVAQTSNAWQTTAVAALPMFRDVPADTASNDCPLGSR
jgi:hypothetical protein